MSASQWAKAFGFVFLIIGVLGFVPGITSNGHLLGIFEVDALHNIIHIVTGIAALLMARNSAKAFFKIFGIVYLIVTIAGFMQGTTVLGLINVNMADNILHLAISAIALWIGFRNN